MICSLFLFFSLGKDVIGQAQSGTGKTATFSIAVLQQLDLNVKECQALVLAPTRELAQQVKILELINHSMHLFLSPWWSKLELKWDTMAS